LQCLQLHVNDFGDIGARAFLALPLTGESPVLSISIDALSESVREALTARFGKSMHWIGPRPPGTTEPARYVAGLLPGT
jgi:hypothetical protein